MALKAGFSAKTLWMEYLGGTLVESPCTSKIYNLQTYRSHNILESSCKRERVNEVDQFTAQ